MNAMKAGGLVFEPHHLADKALFNFERGIILERVHDGWTAMLVPAGQYHMIRESSWLADTAVSRLLEALAALKPAVDRALGVDSNHTGNPDSSEVKQ